MKVYYENRSSDIYCRDSRYAGKTLGFTTHLHYQVELGCILQGRTRITVESECCEAQAGDMFIFFPNQVHRMETIEKEKYILLIVNPELLPEYARTLITTLPKENLLRGAAQDEELMALMHRISNVYISSEPYREEILRGYLLAFFGKLLPKLTLQDIQSRDLHVLGMILNYCAAHSEEDISLGVLERELHLSKYYISHILSAKLHVGFNDYINSLRVSNACRLLLGSNKSITEISEQVGFNTLRTFNRAFMKHMGVTPSGYRNKKSVGTSPSLPI